MKETQVWQRIKPWLETFGHPTRVENMVSNGMTDGIFTANKLTFFLELKVIHSNKISVRNSQLIYVHWMAPHIDEHQHLFICSEELAKQPLRVYSGLQCLTLPSVVHAGNRQSLDLSGVNPLFTWNNKEDVKRSLLPNSTRKAIHGTDTKSTDSRIISGYAERVRDPDC